MFSFSPGVIFKNFMAHVTVKNLIISCYCMLERNNIFVYLCMRHYGFDMLGHVTS